MAAQNLANSICLVFFGWAYDYNPSLPFGGAVVFYWVVIYYTYKLQWIVTPNGSKRSGTHSSFRLLKTRSLMTRALCRGRLGARLVRDGRQDGAPNTVRSAVLSRSAARFG